MVTIIVLLILAGVTISLVIGENGLIGKAMAASRMQKFGEYREKIELIVLDETIERKQKAKEEIFSESIAEKIEKEQWVQNVYRCTENGEEVSQKEDTKLLIVETKDGYEILVEVNNETNEAKVLDSFEKVGKKYKVTFEPNGGDGEKEVKEVKFSIKVEAPKYGKAGFQFIGWNEAEDGSGTMYVVGTKYRPTGDTKLYAIWESKTIKLTLDPNGGEGQNIEIEVGNGSNIVLPENTYTKEGYVFESWNSAADGTGTRYETGQIVNIEDSMTLYAIWQENITASLVLNKGELTEGTEIQIVGTSLDKGIKRATLKIGSQVVYEKEVGVGEINETKTIDNLNNLTNLNFLDEYICELTITSNTGKSKVARQNIVDYTISTEQDLKKVAIQTNEGNNFEDKTITQISDIDLKGSSSNPWVPIGYSNVAVQWFNGTYNGKNHNVSNIYINNSEEKATGLFGFLGYKGSIKNLTIQSGNITVYNDKAVGGIAGINKGTIRKCQNLATINGGIELGGIVGNNGNRENDDKLISNNNVSFNTNEAKIINCINMGNITGEYNIGGVSGINRGTILESANKGDTFSKATNFGNDSDKYSSIGGITAINSGEISSSYNVGSIESNYVRNAGIAAYNNGTIRSCYNTGNLTGNYTSSYGATGGIVGRNDKSIQYCYQIGQIKTAYTQTGINTLGGIVGNLVSGNVDYCYYLTGIVNGSNGGINLADTATVMKKTQTEFKQTAILTNLGSEFVQDTKNINNGFPILKWQI